jgi:hypothetical protein
VVLRKVDDGLSGARGKGRGRGGAGTKTRARAKRKRRRNSGLSRLENCFSFVFSYLSCVLNWVVSRLAFSSPLPLLFRSRLIKKEVPRLALLARDADPDRIGAFSSPLPLLFRFVVS